MHLPFTRSEFLDVFAALNPAIWPLQLLTAALGFACVGFLFWRPGWADRVIAAVLAATWLFTGVVYHWMYFSAINPPARLFGALFVVAGIAFAVEGAARGRVRFQIAADLRSVLAILFTAYALVVYPLIGLIVTDPWPETPLFGVTPCPTTIFTLGLLMIARYQRVWLLAAVPLVWGFIGGSAAFLLEVPQDYGLITAVVIWVAAQAHTPRQSPVRS